MSVPPIQGSQFPTSQPPSSSNFVAAHQRALKWQSEACQSDSNSPACQAATDLVNTFNSFMQINPNPQDQTMDNFRKMISEWYGQNQGLFMHGDFFWQTTWSINPDGEVNDNVNTFFSIIGVNPPTPTPTDIALQQLQALREQTKSPNIGDAYFVMSQNYSSWSLESPHSPNTLEEIGKNILNILAEQRPPVYLNANEKGAFDTIFQIKE